MLVTCRVLDHGEMFRRPHRLVVVVNPRMGNSPMLTTFEAAYLMRPLSLAYMRDQ